MAGKGRGGRGGRGLGERYVGRAVGAAACFFSEMKEKNMSVLYHSA